MARDYPTPAEVFEQVGEHFKTLTVEGAAKFIAPHCRVHEAVGLPEIGGRDWVGPQGFIDLMGAVQAAFNGFDFTFVDMVTDGDTRLAFRGRLTAQLPAGSFDIPIIEYWTFEKGMAVDILPVWHDTKLVAELYAKSYPNGRT